ncbi:MAG: endonuclease [Lentimicrobiaceae bacterium]|nr:endonuclease [Lentimicrobiaceae bacterium]
MKKNVLFLLLFLLLSVTYGQIPPYYYSAAEGKKQNELKIALSEIISNDYIQRTYSDLWTDFNTTDARADGKVWDMYSNCTFTFGDDQDKGGAAPSECICYNREHSIPNSWFGGTNYPMYSDLFHLYPTDKYVNAERADYPYGETNNPVKTYENGSKKGNGASESGYTGMIFEPTDEYKGDFARTYFYMATRYLNINFTQNSAGGITFTYGNSTCDLTDYAINLFLKWHRNDVVGQKEMSRNNAVYGIQNNRNPFIDYPELVEHIWGNLQDVAWKPNIGISNHEEKSNIRISKNHNGIYIDGAAPDAKIDIYSVVGQHVLCTSLNHNFISLEHLNKGVYIIKIGDYAGKIVW